MLTSKVAAILLVAIVVLVAAVFYLVNTHMIIPEHIPHVDSFVKMAQEPTKGQAHKQQSIQIQIQNKMYNVPADIKLLLPWNPTVIADGRTAEQAEDTYKGYIQKIEVECRSRSRVGNMADGGWDICLAEPYKPTSGCLVYDFGISNAWTFDDAFVQEYGCDVRAFDPTMNQKEHLRGERIYFYPVGLHGSNRMMNIMGTNVPVKTLGTMRKDYGDENRVIDYLKIDIEYSEWASIPAMIEEGFLATHVKQIGLETHHHYTNDMSLFQNYVKILSSLESQGFRKWHYHWNPNCIYKTTSSYFTKCIEVYYINVNFLSKS